MGLNTELGERKLTILKAIIQNYLETGEPVGSRTLSKYTDLNLSSATDTQTRWLIWRIWDTFSSRTLRQEGFLPTKATAYMWIC